MHDSIVQKDKSIRQQTEQAYSHWLCNIEGIGRKTHHRLIRAAGSAEAVSRMMRSDAEKILKPEQMKQFLRAQQTDDLPEKILQEYQKLLQRNIRCIPADDPDFPIRLRTIPDPPAVLYVLGQLPEEKCPSVAIIGARACSEYGRAAARRFAGALAAAGVNVISGLARGIDGIGQAAALDHGGRTYAVMGCGVDVCYPEENRGLYDRIPIRGGILSESPPGTLPVAGLFPQRNRIISGLADVVLVIEARERSGTLITVDMALEQGKEVAVLPGRITDRLSFGCNQLARQGAALALDPSDILRMLEECRRTRPSGYGQLSLPLLSDDPAEKDASLGHETSDILAGNTAPSDPRRAVHKALDYTPQTISQLHARLQGMPIPELTHHLLQLIAEKKCAQAGGQFYLTEF